MIHISWILIIVGEGVTRYIVYEGFMPIRENSTSKSFLSEKTYLTVFADGENDGQIKRKVTQGDLLFSEHTNNFFKWNNNFFEQNFSIEYVNFIENAKEDLVDSFNQT